MHSNNNKICTNILYQVLISLFYSIIGLSIAYTVIKLVPTLKGDVYIEDSFIIIFFGTYLFFFFRELSSYKICMKLELNTIKLKIGSIDSYDDVIDVKISKNFFGIIYIFNVNNYHYNIKVNKYMFTKKEFNEISKIVQQYVKLSHDNK